MTYHRNLLSTEGRKEKGTDQPLLNMTSHDHISREPMCVNPLPFVAAGPFRPQFYTLYDPSIHLADLP
jgi:hypothetical protein